MALLCWPWTLDQYDGNKQLKKFHLQLLRDGGYLQKRFMEPPKKEDYVVQAVRDLMFHICDPEKTRHVIVGTDSETGLESMAGLLLCAWLLTFKSRVSWTTSLELSNLFSQREWSEETDERMSDLQNSRLLIYTNPHEADRRMEYAALSVTRLIRQHMINPVRKTVFFVNREEERAFRPATVSNLLQRHFPESFVNFVLESCTLIWRPTA